MDALPGGLAEAFQQGREGVLQRLQDRPEDWKEQMNRRDRFHHVRVAVIIAAFALLAAAPA